MKPTAKRLTFDDYREKLLAVGPRPREVVLAHAEENLPFDDFIRLCELAYPDPA